MTNIDYRLERDLYCLSKSQRKLREIALMVYDLYKSQVSTMVRIQVICRGSYIRACRAMIR